MGKFKEMQIEQMNENETELIQPKKVIMKRKLTKTKN